MSAWIDSLALWQTMLLLCGGIVIALFAAIGMLCVGLAIHEAWERRQWEKAAEEAREMERVRIQPAPRSGT